MKVSFHYLLEPFRKRLSYRILQSRAFSRDSLEEVSSSWTEMNFLERERLLAQ